MTPGPVTYSSSTDSITPEKGGLKIVAYVRSVALKHALFDTTIWVCEITNEINAQYQIIMIPTGILLGVIWLRFIVRCLLVFIWDILCINATIF